MNTILLISQRTDALEKWRQVLELDYTVEILSDFTVPELPYPLTVLDADFIDQGKLQISAIKHYPGKLLIIGDHWPEALQVKVVVAGAAGYCECSTSNSVILKAVESILQGDIWVQRHLVPQVIGTLVKITRVPAAPPPKPAPAGFDSLSPRERDVVRLILQGISNKVIAAELFISERTVKAHLTSIFKKLHVPDRLHLAILLKESEELLDNKKTTKTLVES
ncbi:MAG: LuxR C-terminal-related transcriptional regulator [Methylobacter sp.]